MLDSLTVVNQQGDALELPLWDVDNGFIVKEITGLDPVKANIVTSNFAQIDGDQYQNSHREKRNPVIKLEISKDHPTLDVRALRQKLYKFFMPKMAVSMIFGDSSGANYLITGRIETFDAPLFTKDPEATISVLCFDPDFYLPETTTVEGNTVASATAMGIEYAGDIEVGVEFKLNVNRTMTGFTIYQTAGNDYIRTIEITYDFLAGDVVTIVTVANQKKVVVKRAGIDYSILYAMSAASSWVTLQPGENTFRVYAEGAAVPYTVAYRTKFGGL